MNLVKSQDTEEKFYVVMTEFRRNLWGSEFIEKVKEYYGDRVVFMTLEEFDSQHPRNADFMILDEMAPIVNGQMRIGIQKNDSLYKHRKKQHWQRGRW